MALANLTEIPRTPNDYGEWSFANMASHRDIIRVLFQLTSERLDEYVLDPFDPKNMGNWPYLHQIMHDQMNRALGIGGFILSGIDWSNPHRVSGWIQAHANEHFRVSSILNLG